jgi:hypothetical protein
MIDHGRVAAIQAELEARLAVGHETACSGCGMIVDRIAPPAAGLVEDALRFGKPDYVHPGFVTCPGPVDDGSKRIDRGRP